jgi:ribosomal protein S18 acetylase RimI-like enzyme
MTIEIRRFAERDLPFIVELINGDRKGSYEFFPYTEERFREWIQEGKLKILIAEENGRVLGSGAYYDGYWGEEIEWLIVPENPSQKLVESMLLVETEKYVQKGTVFTVVDDGSPKMDQWTERGYKLQGGLCHMVATLDTLRPLPEVPEGTTIRSFRSVEERELVDAVNAGFGTERLKMGDVERWKSENPPFSEKWIQIAEINSRIVSVVVAKPDTRYNERFNGNRGYLGPASTLPEYQGRNLASALTVQAMNFLLEKGFDSVALHTSELNVPSLALLRKLGFKTGHHWRFMRKTLAKLA